MQTENEEDLSIAVKIAKLYCRPDKRMSVNGLKTLLSIYNSPVFVHAVALYPKDRLIKGLLTLLTLFDAKFNLSEEAKVPKDLLHQEVTSAADANELFAAFPHGKARRMRQEVFQVLKQI